MDENANRGGCLKWQRGRNKHRSLTATYVTVGEKERRSTQCGSRKPTKKDRTAISLLGLMRVLKKNDAKTDLDTMGDTLQKKNWGRGACEG